MSGWRRNLYIMWFVQFAGTQSLTFVVSFMSLYVVDLGVADKQQQGMWTGILIGISALMAIFSGPFWGSIADKKGRKMMVERVLFSGAIITALMSLTTSVWQFLILRIFQGIFGGIVSSCVSLVTCITPKERTGFALGLMQNALIIGSTTSPLIGGFLVDFIGFKATFLIMASFSLVAGLLVFFSIKEDFKPTAKASDSDFFNDIKSLLKIPGIVALGTINFVIQFSNMVIYPLLPDFLLNVNPNITYLATLTGVIVAISGLFSGLSAVLSGYFSDKLGSRKTLISLNILSILIFLSHTLVETINSLIFLRVLAGVVTGGMLPVINSMVNSILPPDKNAIGFGITTGFLLMGSVLGPLLGGILPHYFGFAGVFIITALLFVGALMFAITATQRSDSNSSLPKKSIINK